MLLPALLRSSLPDAAIGFFLHIPFPSFEIFRLLPQRKELLRGLLGADVIGFHIFDYGRHFLSSCLRLLGLPSLNGTIEYEGRRIKVAPYPIGIDYEKFRTQLGEKDTKEALKQLDESYKGQKLILSVDRLDYSKGIPERLEAFRLLLEDYPKYRGKVKLLMIAVPSREGVAAYQQLRDEIERTVSRINGTYGTVGWAPISYQFQNRPFSEVVALYARADVALITPIRDGMNLVAKEYVASKKNRKGVLVLSEMTGAIDDLPEALTINPNDTRETAKAIDTALRMPANEQKQALHTMQQRLKVATVTNWSSEFMHDLQAAATDRTSMPKGITRTQHQRIVSRFKAARRRLIILDYDGTLRGFVKTPSALAAAPPVRVWRILKQLVDTPDTTTAVVSGRPYKTLARWFVGLPLKLAAEHGAWVRYGRSWQHIDTNFKKDKKRIRAIMQETVDRTAGSEIEEKDYAMVWHYVNVEPDLAYKRMVELRQALVSELADDSLSVHQGHNIIEVKPRKVSKGAVVRELLEKYPSDFILCIGDDYTDEDMFAELENNDSAVTIKVGNGATKARFQLEKPVNVLSLLNECAPVASLEQLKGISRKIPRKIPRWFRR